MVKLSKDYEKIIKKLKMRPEYWLVCVKFKISLMLWKLFKIEIDL